LAGTQLETQVSFGWAACGFDQQSSVGIGETRHVEGEVGFAGGG
jgi:hypothetical protein